MKFSVSSSDLLKKLQIAGGAVASNNVLPILENFLFVISGDTLTITGSDLETTISTELSVKSDDDIKVAIPAKMLIDTLKELPDQPISISVDQDKFGVSISSSSGNYDFSGRDGEEYPQPPRQDDVDSITLQSSMLQKGINKTVFATSPDELRPAMTGVFFQIDFGKITLVATDAQKLVRYTFDDIESDVSDSFILPKKALNLLKNSLPSDGDVTLSFNKANAFLAYGDIRVACRLIDARFPDYENVIPKDNPNELRINHSDFKSALKRTSIYANKTTNQIIFDITANTLTLSSQDTDFSYNATERMICTYTGEPMKIGFNAKFLLELLNATDGDELAIKLSTPQRPGLMSPVEQMDGEDILMLVMPLILR